VNAHNKALQTDNLRGVACVHARCAPIAALCVERTPFPITEKL